MKKNTKYYKCEQLICWFFSLIPFGFPPDVSDAWQRWPSRSVRQSDPDSVAAGEKACIIAAGFDWRRNGPGSCC